MAAQIQAHEVGNYSITGRAHEAIRIITNGANSATIVKSYFCAVLLRESNFAFRPACLWLSLHCFLRIQTKPYLFHE